MLVFFLRDLVYIAAQVYISLPGFDARTKAASVAGGVGAYLYLLLLNYWDTRSLGLDMIVFTLNCLALANLAVEWPDSEADFARALADDLNVS